jgi:pyruvate/2-oxoglutarate dehydrogenase complex dihydrolipoamide acyltransferase (E2) component
LTTPVTVPWTDVNSDSAIVMEWRVADRAEVHSGAVVAEIETSKAALEIEAPCDGVLTRIEELAGATVATTLPGSTVEIRAASGPEGELEDWPLLAEGELEESTDFSFEEPATTRYVLVWVTALVEGDGGFEANLAEVELLAAG